MIKSMLKYQNFGSFDLYFYVECVKSIYKLISTEMLVSL